MVAAGIAAAEGEDPEEGLALPGQAGRTAGREERLEEVGRLDTRPFSRQVLQRKFQCEPG